MKRLLCAFACVLGVGACSQFNDWHIADLAVINDSQTSVAVQQGSDSAKPIDLSTYCFPEQKQTETACNETAYKAATKGRQARNRLMMDIMRNSEQICNYHKGAILSTSAALDFSTGLTSAVLSTLSAAFTPVTTVRALSAGSAISTATGTGIRANVYQNLLVPAIITEIEIKRLALHKKILSRMVESTTDYSINEALYDIEQYHEQCSFYVGVAELAKDRTPKARSQEDIQNEIDQLIKQREVARVRHQNAGELEKEGAKTEFIFYDNRIMDLLRLKAISPGQIILPQSVPEVEVDQLADSAVDAFTRCEGSLLEIAVALAGMESDKRILEKAEKEAIKTKANTLEKIREKLTIVEAALTKAKAEKTTVSSYVENAKVAAISSVNNAAIIKKPDGKDEDKIKATVELGSAVSNAENIASKAEELAKSVREQAINVRKAVTEISGAGSAVVPTPAGSKTPVTTTPSSPPPVN